MAQSMDPINFEQGQGMSERVRSDATISPPWQKTQAWQPQRNQRGAKSVLLEICATSLDLAIAAQRAGAHRIELCSDLASGGITPSAGLMETAREHLHIPIHVLIRPRPGSFFYSAHEFQIMRSDIQNAKRAGMDGVVLGLLNRKSRVDVARTRELVELAYPLPVTFHRAFDETQCWQESLEAVIQTGARRLLTSGCRRRAVDGLGALAGLVQQAGDRIVVMPGGGITPAYFLRVVRATSAREIHASFLTPALRKGAGTYPPSWAQRYYKIVLKVTSLLEARVLISPRSEMISG